MNLTRVGTQIEVPTGVLEPVIREALAAIDQVHLVTDLPTVPVVYGSQRFGGYVPAADNVERHIDLSPEGPHPHLTLLHEVGHLLDDRLGEFVVYSSTLSDSILAEVVRVIQASRTMVEIREYLTAEAHAPLQLRFQLLNWQEPVEAWARAYAQYIALRSGNARLQQEVKVAMHLDAIEISRNVQWEEDDFVPIAEAIDAVFRRLGWRP